MRPTELAHQNRGDGMTLRPCEGSALALPGFNAFGPEWMRHAAQGGSSPPRDSGARVGAPVASQRCRILRPGANSIGLFDSEAKKKLPDSPPAEYNWICPA